MPLTQREAQRGHVLTLLASGKVTTAQAAEALGITRRQLRRLGSRLRAGGPTALAHGNRGRRAGRAVPDDLRGQITFAGCSRERNRSAQRDPRRGPLPQPSSSAQRNPAISFEATPARGGGPGPSVGLGTRPCGRDPGERPPGKVASARWAERLRGTN